MKVILKTDEYTIYQKRSERYAVAGSDKAWINGDAKTAILLEHKLINAAAPKPAEPEAAEEVDEAVDSTGEETEAAAEAAEPAAEADAEAGGEADEADK